MKFLLILALGLPTCSTPATLQQNTPRAAAEQPALAAAAAAAMPESDLLAENIVTAEYTGTQEIPCRFMTALCPDKCDHATKVATFRVIANESYAKHSEYGDEKMEAGEIIPVDILHPAPGQVALPSLTAGNQVRMTIQHRYTKGNVQEPIRPVTAIEKL